MNEWVVIGQETISSLGCPPPMVNLLTNSDPKTIEISKEYS